MKKHLSLKKLLQKDKFLVVDKSSEESELQHLQLQWLRVQQGIWHQKKRLIIALEGFDAAGKGGAIRRLVENLDPRGVKVHAIGPPDPVEQGKHYLYRFWQRLPAPGTIAIFDRTWYGRVLVEKVQSLTPKSRVKQAYPEIRHFENILLNDGIEMVKIFLAIDKKEQERRFEERLQDPYKQWKLTMDDVQARRHWNQYVDAVDEMFAETHTKESPWHLIPANDKAYARQECLKLVIHRFGHHKDWIEEKVERHEVKNLKEALKELGLEKKSLK